MRASLSRVSILGVVPEAISEWKPEIAPQATVMKANGKTLPPNSGPVPSTNWVSGGIRVGGCSAMIPTASSAMVPSLMNADR